MSNYEKESHKIGSAWIKRKAVSFIAARITPAGAEILKRIAALNGKATFLLLPNRYKTNSKSPDYNIYVEFRRVT